MKKEEIMFLVKEFMDTQTAMEVRDVLDWVLKKETEAMAQPVEKAQRQEPVDPMPVNPEKFKRRQDEIYFRALSLEAALAVYKRNGFLPIKSMAQNFYRYITKGE